jgi:hypothetical protein
MIGPITRGMKQAGKRSAGKPHAAFDVAGAGNVTMVAGLRSTTKVMELPPAPTVRAPALDPTDVAGNGNPDMVELMRHSQRKRRAPARLDLRPIGAIS